MSDVALCQRLDWDSAFFGISIARAVPTHVDKTICHAILDWCHTHRIDCLYFLADEDNRDSRRVLEDATFVHVDDRVTLTLDPVPVVIVSPDTRAAVPEDLPALRAIAAMSHHDSRFYNDGHFDRAQCDELYRVWIANSCAGWADQVVVVEQEGRAIGYVTVHLREPEAAVIGLFGVDPAFRRRGIGGRLLTGALAWASSQSVRRMSVVTQGRNGVSMAFYQDTGFRPTGRSVWYHRWFLPGRRFES
jgi:RimJ/RimL family protein N-acetyltransferase